VLDLLIYLDHLKKIIADKNDKIGHFGPLILFATGVLMVGIGGAAKLNDFIHSEMPKTYLAIGKLGVDTDSGDWEGEIKQVDESRYIKEVIGSFDQNFIQEILAKKLTELICKRLRLFLPQSFRASLCMSGHGKGSL
jgi:tRNA U55 pseudouridine synthase TruB